MSACSVRGEKCITIYSYGCFIRTLVACFVSLQTGWEWLELLTRSSSRRMWLSTYLDRGAHILEDSWGQSVPHRSSRCPYSTWMLAGSLRPGCGRDVSITLWKVNENWSVKTDITSFFLNNWLPFSSSILSGADLETYPGLFWMQRRARLKAMFRHSSSEEAMSLCRSFYKQWHKAVTDTLTRWQVLHLTSCVCCLWLTMKYWMISGLLLDFSSTSVNTSNTSIVDRERKKQHCMLFSSFWYRFKCETAGSPLPSTASPLDIFFRYIVMSAALSETEADMLTRGREPVDMSSNREQKQSWSEVWRNVPHCGSWNTS